MYTHSDYDISDQLSNLLLAEASQAERIGRLTDNQLQIIVAQKWFKLFVPKELDGLEISLLEGIRIQEQLAAIDGSLGWTVTLCSGATFFAGYLEHSIAKELFGQKNACFAGSGRADGIARKTENGYIVSGKWHYATGAPHATVFTANCIIEEGGSVLTNEQGSPTIKSFLFKNNEVTIHENWKSFGMVATAGHSFEVNDLYVPANRSFIIDSKYATWSHPIYRYPFLQFAEATIAANTLGMAGHFFNLCENIFFKRGHDKGDAEQVISKRVQLLFEGRETLKELRRNFYVSIEETWEQMLRNSSIKNEALNNLSVSANVLVHEIRRLVAELYPYCGIMATDPDADINRVWRDIFTASQHGALK